jgi:hypothetical protein
VAEEGLFSHFFITITLTLIAVGAWRVMTGTVEPVLPVDAMPQAGAPLTLFLLLTAFSSRHGTRAGRRGDHQGARRRLGGRRPGGAATRSSCRSADCTGRC